ncbi:MAG: hypothetical protein R3D27_06275 [Hyphomicrobiaceae bacterium]
MRQKKFAGMVLAIALITAGAAAAQDKAAKPVELTPEELAEKEGRKACKVAICAAFRAKKPGGDIACNVIKSWRKEQLDRIVSKARASWPWGPVRCTVDIKLPREALIKAVSEPKYELKLEPHSVACTVQREKEPAEIKFSFAPKVQFEAGKAVKAKLHWGQITAPTLVKTAMWTATATDNTFNVLEGTVVEDINDFISTKCDEVKDEWSK